MALTIGAVLAVLVGAMATAFGLDRDRAFYPVVALVVATYYVLFAAMGASTEVLVVEALAGTVFIAAGLVGFRSSLWIVVAALAGHGIFDAVHGSLIANPGVPQWWPAFCGAYDVAAAAYLAWLIKGARIKATAA